VTSERWEAVSSLTGLIETVVSKQQAEACPIVIVCTDQQKAAERLELYIYSLLELASWFMFCASTATAGG
jgi:hypothetical protein